MLIYYTIFQEICNKNQNDLTSAFPFYQYPLRPSFILLSPSFQRIIKLMFNLFYPRNEWSSNINMMEQNSCKEQRKLRILLTFAF